MAQTPSQFTGWSKPLAEEVARALIKVAPHGTPIDLGQHRVIVPSSFASRLIMEHLARLAPEGVLLPKFQTPDNMGERVRLLGSSLTLSALVGEVGRIA